jgi:signal peptidase I
MSETENIAQPGKTALPEESWTEFLRTVIYAIVIAVVFRTAAYEPFNIPSESMVPTLLYGDYLLVSKSSYGYSKHSLPFDLPLFEGRIFADEVERGDVAVFKWPGDNSTAYIKRIVGLPGDKMQVLNGLLHINGEAVKRERVEDFHHPDNDAVYPQYEETLPNGVTYRTLDCKVTYVTICRTAGDNTKVYTVPVGHYFAMGDNRDNSSDSRFPKPPDGIHYQLPGTGVGFVPAVNLVGRADVLFFSTCGSDCDAPLWKPWNWPGALRYSRFFDAIN